MPPLPLLLGPEARLHGVDDLRVEPHATDIDKPLGPNDVRVQVGHSGLFRRTGESMSAVVVRPIPSSAMAGYQATVPRGVVLRFRRAGRGHQLEQRCCCSSDRCTCGGGDRSRVNLR